MSQTNEKTAEKTAVLEKPLEVATVDSLKENTVDAAGIAVDLNNPELNQKADVFIEKLLKADNGDIQRASIDSIGEETQKLAGRSEMLKDQIRVLSNKGADGGEVAKSLLDLKNTVEELDPNKFDFENPKNFLIRVVRALPFIGKPLQQYFEKYMSSQEVIDAIITSLQHGREILLRDNKILSNDQKNMRVYKDRLIELIKFMHVLDKKLEDKAFDVEQTDADQAKFIREELLFPHRQRIQDMQQTLLVNQQGILTIEVIIRNNRELVRGVDRALRVTIKALEIAVSLSMALAHQKIVLDKIQALNTTTNNLIAGTARMLKTQGVEIHKQASSTSLDMNVLKQAFADIHSAMEDISKFRLEALPRMKKDIDDMQIMADDAEKTIKKMEAGSKAQAKITVDFDGEEFKVGSN